jgi:dihydroorotate dehydrogenase (fumarate)
VIVIKIGNLTLEQPVFLAAGSCKYPNDAHKVLASPSAALVVGSITTEPYGEEVGDQLWCDGARSVTGFGFPNPGMEVWGAELPRLADAARKAGKPFVVNVAGDDVADYVQLAERAFAAGASAVELNLAWPCLRSEDGRQMYAFADDPTAVAELLRVAAERIRGERRDLWLKFSPLQPTMLTAMANAIRTQRDAPVTAVTCCGPYPKTLFLDADNTSVVGTDAFGQIGGEFLRPIALGQVRQFRALLPDEIAVIGLGGVSIHAHVDQYLSMGASAVGLTTAYKIGGADIFAYLVPGKLAA